MSLGTVANNYSNYLAILAIDGAHASAFLTPVSDGEENFRDFGRANEAMESGEFAFPLGSGSGVLSEVGGCGVATVYRVDDGFLILEHYGPDDEDAVVDDEMLAAVAAHRSDEPIELGTFEVTSGVLALMGLLDDFPALDLATVTEAGGVVQTPAGVAIAVAPGRYRVVREALGDEIRGPFGTIASFVRIVPAL